MKHIKIFDTTLRDGEQTPRVNLNAKEKLRIAKQLESLGVDIIEAGFAVASPGDFEAVKMIAENVEKSTVTSLSRAVKKDIEVAAEAVKNAKKPRIHTFIATSPIHREYKLKMTKEHILDRVKEMVSYAKSFIDDIEFSSEDATRTEKEFLVEVYETAIKAGATTLNVPDTVGYRTPNEMFELITYLKKNVKGIENVDISVHCHDDLGLSVANSVAAIQAGATQIECTINGLGERAGNTSLEEATDMFNKSHIAVLESAEKFTNEELFSKGVYKWTAGSTLGSYFVSATSSHYDWAMKKLKAHKKNCK